MKIKDNFWLGLLVGAASFGLFFFLLHFIKPPSNCQHTCKKILIVFSFIFCIAFSKLKERGIFTRMSCVVSHKNEITVL